MFCGLAQAFLLLQRKGQDMNGGKEVQEQDRFLRLWQVLEIVPVSKSTWWSWCASGKAPKPVKLSERTTVWSYREIIAYMNQAMA